MLLPPNNIAFTECPSPPLTGVASPPLIQGEDWLGATYWSVLE